MDSSNSCYAFDPFCRINNRDFMPVPSGFSAYDLLRNCGYLLRNTNSDSRLPLLSTPTNHNIQKLEPDRARTTAAAGAAATCVNLVSTSFLTPSSILPYSHSIRVLNDDQIDCRFSSTNNVILSSQINSTQKKQRSEKRPIPEEQKDDKYFERRRRNNQAAKKSRDARKLREDQIAMKASILEQENAILRAQVLTLREETSSLRQMLLDRKPFDIIRGESDLCSTTKHTQ